MRIFALYALILAMSAFVTFANVKVLEKVFKKYPTSPAVMAGLGVWLSTVWKSALIFGLVLFALRGSEPRFEYGDSFVVGFVSGGFFASFMGMMTAFAAAWGARKSLAASQIAASIALNVQTLAVLGWIIYLRALSGH